MDSSELFSSYASLMLRKDSVQDEPDSVGQSSASTYNGRLADVTQEWCSDNAPGSCYLTGQNVTPTSDMTKTFGSNSLILRRNIYVDRTGRKPELQLEIHSPGLKNSFRQMTPRIRIAINVLANPIVIKAPYGALYHFREEIFTSNLACTEKSHETRLLHTELTALRKFMDINMGSSTGAIDSLKQVGKMSVEHLWSLFKPGDAVLLRHQAADGQLETACGIVQCFSTIPEKSLWCLKVQHMSFENGRFGVIEKDYWFANFEGQVAITALPAYPIRYCVDPEGMKKELVQRGKAFIRLCHNKRGDGHPAHMTYCGPVWVPQKDYSTEGCAFLDPPKTLVCGRVIVDPVGFVNEFGIFRERIIARSLSDDNTSATEASNDIGVVNLAKLSKEEMMTFPSRIAGYALSTKEAGFFQIDGLYPITWETARAEEVRQSSWRMRKVLQIASGFRSLSADIDYRIEHKGKGLVVLLFGDSGTGKTLTAECVAESLHLPLYRVSGSDVGTGLREIEPCLASAFSRATRWGAVMLFDEADAFMARRKDEAIEQNAMVSILLRLVEYQTGIVILTTNRRTDFDPAFHSRIHVTLEYNGLTSEERECIWRHEVGRLHASAISDAEYRRLAQLFLDGRTVKNVVHVAMMFQEGGHKGPMSLTVLRQVLDVATGGANPTARKEIIEFCQTAE